VSTTPTRGPVQRPDLDRDLIDIFQRLADIERIAQGIRCDFENVCGSLHITVGPDGITDFKVHSTDGASGSLLLQQPSGIGLFGQSIIIGSTDPDTSATGDTVVNPGEDLVVNVPAGNKVKVKLAAGAEFELLNSTNNPILQMTEGSSDLHIPTGGSVIADL
jgi:hypothetical protein